MLIERACEHCGKAFKVDASRLKHGRGRNCSPACQHASIKSRPSGKSISAKCVGCGEVFWRAQSLMNGDGRKGSGKYCNRACRDKNWKGAATPNWQDGSGVYKRGPHWHATRRRILKRDGACVCCGATEKLHVHHVIPFRMFSDQDQANDESNLVALCPPCHRRADARSKWVRLPDSGAIIRMNAGGYAWQLAREKGMI